MSTRLILALGIASPVALGVGLTYAHPNLQSAPHLAFAQPAYVADEVTPPGVPRRLELRLTDVGASRGPISVTVRAAGGTATLGVDFTFAADPGGDAEANSGPDRPADLPTDHVVVGWAADDMSARFVEYRIVDDAIAEPGEEIQFELVDPHGAEIDAAIAKTRTWIYDDDYPGATVLKQAAGHDMLYYLAMPTKDASDEPIPVVFAIDGAGGWYRGLDDAYRTARGDRPFILVTPITRSSGAPWPALAEYYPADIADTAARFAFDEDGLLAIWADLRAAGVAVDETFYVTGYSGGGLLAYRMIFHHPELLAAAAPACPNFWPAAVGRVSASPARSTLPITVFQGMDDPYLQGHMEPQWLLAQRVLAERGYGNVNRRVVPGGHEPFAEHVLSYFAEHPAPSAMRGRTCYLPYARR